MLIDSHAHLNDEKLINEADSICNDMEQDGLSCIINVGYDRESSEKSFELSQKYEKIFSVLGIHPHDSDKYSKDDCDRFTELSRNSKVVAIGEIGLDFYYDLSPRETQEKVFIEQLDLAYNLHKPVVIHLRDAYQLMYKLLKENEQKLKYGAILHCYSGSKEMMTEFSKMGLYFSYGGAVTFKNASEKPDIVRATPLDRLLLETDCPYMTPVPYRGKTNYPKYVNLVCDKISEFLGMEREQTAKITTENAKRFFGLTL